MDKLTKAQQKMINELNKNNGSIIISGNRWVMADKLSNLGLVNVNYIETITRSSSDWSPRYKVTLK